MPRQIQSAILLCVALAAGIGSSCAISSMLAKHSGSIEIKENVTSAKSTNVGIVGKTDSKLNRCCEFWPPVVGKRYPDLVLKDSKGETFRLSDHTGKLVFIELAAVPCRGCQAFAGGNEYGGFAGVEAQRGLESIHDYTRRIASINLRSNHDVLFVQLLLYGNKIGAPTKEETKGWAEHFRMNGSDSQVVLRGDPSMVNSTTYSMIPGFHLIDRDFILRSDSCGHSPKENLYTELLPKLRELAREPKPSTTTIRKVSANPFVKRDPGD